MLHDFQGLLKAVCMFIPPIATISGIGKLSSKATAAACKRLQTSKHINDWHAAAKIAFIICKQAFAWSWASTPLHCRPALQGTGFLGATSVQRWKQGATLLINLVAVLSALL